MDVKKIYSNINAPPLPSFLVIRCVCLRAIGNESLGDLHGCPKSPFLLVGNLQSVGRLHGDFCNWKIARLLSPSFSCRYPKSLD